MQYGHNPPHVGAAPTAAAGEEKAVSKVAEAPEKPAWVASISSQREAFELLAGPDNAAKLQDLLERSAASLEVDPFLQSLLGSCCMHAFVPTRHTGTHGLCKRPLSRAWLTMLLVEAFIEACRLKPFQRRVPLYSQPGSGLEMSTLCSSDFLTFLAFGAHLPAD